MTDSSEDTIFDVAVIGAGPAGTQAAISAAHQMRHVLILDAGPISQRKGRAYWSKSVEFQDVPVFGGITGPKFVHALRAWLHNHPERAVTIGGQARPTGIRYQPAVVLRVTRATDETFQIDTSTAPLRFERSEPQRGFGGAAPAGPAEGQQIQLGAPRPVNARPEGEQPSTRGAGAQGVRGSGAGEAQRAGPWAASPGGRGQSPLRTFFARRLVVASGFEDKWPDIEVDDSANRLYRRHRALFRFAGNRKGWHVCIRCDGHLHVDEHLAVLATGDYAWYAARGAQDFTDTVTILTSGRPLDLSDERLAVLEQRNIPIIQEKIVAHVGKGTDLLGLRLEDGRELYFDGFLLDEGQSPNTGYLHEANGWRLKIDSEGQIYVDEDGQVLDPEDCPIPGLYAAGDIVAEQRNLIATAFGLGQNAGLAASDSLREW